MATNRPDRASSSEYELLDTGVFDDDRFVDVDVEYAKAGPEDVHVRITVSNRGDDRPRCTCCRRCGSATPGGGGGPRGSCGTATAATCAVIAASTPTWASSSCTVRATELLFTENETNTERLWGVANATPYVKDAFHRYVVEGHTDAVNPARTGTKAAAHSVLDLPAGAPRTVALRLCRPDAPTTDDAAAVGEVFADTGRRGRRVLRIDHPAGTPPDEAR